MPINSTSTAGLDAYIAALAPVLFGWPAVTAGNPTNNDLAAEPAAAPGAKRKATVPTVVVLRGLPGSGKSTVARALGKCASARGMSCTIASADDYFMRAPPGSSSSISGSGNNTDSVSSNSSGVADSVPSVYTFDRSQLPAAHAACYASARAALLGSASECLYTTRTISGASRHEDSRLPGCDLLVIDNTNIELEHYEKYAALAAEWPPSPPSQSLSSLLPPPQFDGNSNAQLEPQPRQSGARFVVFEVWLDNGREPGGPNEQEAATYCTAANVHGVPLAAVEHMLSRWQEDPRSTVVHRLRLPRPLLPPPQAIPLQSKMPLAADEATFATTNAKAAPQLSSSVCHQQPDPTSAVAPTASPLPRLADLMPTSGGVVASDALDLATPPTVKRIPALQEENNASSKVHNCENARITEDLENNSLGSSAALPGGARPPPSAAAFSAAIAALDLGPFSALSSRAAETLRASEFDPISSALPTAALYGAGGSSSTSSSTGHDKGAFIHQKNNDNKNNYDAGSADPLSLVPAAHEHTFVAPRMLLESPQSVAALLVRCRLFAVPVGTLSGRRSRQQTSSNHHRGSGTSTITSTSWTRTNGGVNFGGCSDDEDDDDVSRAGSRGGGCGNGTINSKKQSAAATTGPGLPATLGPEATLLGLAMGWLVEANNGSACPRAIDAQTTSHESAASFAAAVGLDATISAASDSTVASEQPVIIAKARAWLTHELGQIAVAAADAESDVEVDTISEVEVEAAAEDEWTGTSSFKRSKGSSTTNNNDYTAIDVPGPSSWVARLFGSGTQRAGPAAQNAAALVAGSDVVAPGITAPNNNNNSKKRARGAEVCHSAKDSGEKGEEGGGGGAFTKTEALAATSYHAIKAQSMALEASNEADSSAPGEQVLKRARTAAAANAITSATSGGIGSTLHAFGTWLFTAGGLFRSRPPIESSNTEGSTAEVRAAAASMPVSERLVSVNGEEDRTWQEDEKSADTTAAATTAETAVTEKEAAKTWEGECAELAARQAKTATRELEKQAQRWVHHPTALPARGVVLCPSVSASSASASASAAALDLGPTSVDMAMSSRSHNSTAGAEACSSNDSAVADNSTTAACSWLAPTDLPTLCCFLDLWLRDLTPAGGQRYGASLVAYKGSPLANHSFAAIQVLPLGTQPATTHLDSGPERSASFSSAPGSLSSSSTSSSSALHSSSQVGASLREQVGFSRLQQGVNKQAFVAWLAPSDNDDEQSPETMKDSCAASAMAEDPTIAQGTQSCTSPDLSLEELLRTLRTFQNHHECASSMKDYATLAVAAALVVRSRLRYCAINSHRAFLPDTPGMTFLRAEHAAAVAEAAAVQAAAEAAAETTAEVIGKIAAAEAAAEHAQGVHPGIHNEPRGTSADMVASAAASPVLVGGVSTEGFVPGHSAPPMPAFKRKKRRRAQAAPLSEAARRRTAVLARPPVLDPGAVLRQRPGFSESLDSQEGAVGE